jgi:hypothetical protein
MSNGLVAFMMGIGVATWVYSKMYGRTGGNSQSAGIVAGIAGLVAAGIMLIVLAMIPS